MCQKVRVGVGTLPLATARKRSSLGVSGRLRIRNSDKKPLFLSKITNRINGTRIPRVTGDRSVVDPNTLDPDPEFWPNWDPDTGLC